MNRDLIIAAYRTLLGRDPESEDVINAKLHSARSEEALLRGFVASSEFKSRHADMANALGEGYGERRGVIETDVEPAQLDTLFKRVHNQWSALGEIDPYWSVLSDEKFRKKNMNADSWDEFFSSGHHFVALLDVFADRTQTAIPSGTCLEIGCGVGRLTVPLAQRFDTVVATDISASNLAICRENLAAAGVSNVDTRLVSRVEEVDFLPTCDMLVSVLVLQHNPPPIMKWMLAHLLARVRVDGLAFFQVPTSPIGYSFELEQYLKTPSPEMEMHALPMFVVFELLIRNGYRPLEVIMDNHTGGYGSHTFFAIREAIRA